MERALRLHVACKMYEGKKAKRRADGMGYCSERGIVACGEDDVPRLRAAPRGGPRNKVCNVIPYIFLFPCFFGCVAFCGFCRVCG